ncbi:uncharacterized protein PODANS_5_4850 [Podospora anserina S mat+]|uniref:Podospora anserina S mat+ genomic DNA chromosome 5, supercontig 5 n=2 Tax=Podospora anserina TaxID=2587412 RepID=B2AMT3_PODAN|nr:uncharacterized protein PODANS_5_4850 [Podospora anserina S mat+]CAD60571.1 unnamed protein product [Podospora anserina]CAP65249.1 unnamed protein product [Podospora anserina S mat+]CDP29461.1 Putative protein of unknown function [Podospora anserina S mat+]
MTQAFKNVVVVGGSYVGVATAKELANLLPSSHRPRFAILPSHEHKCLIPYTTTFSLSPDPSRHEVIQAKALSLSPTTSTLHLDTPFQGSTTVPFTHLIAATGTNLSPPGTIPHNTKPRAITFFQSYQSSLRTAPSIIIIGGGAVGVQMACDLKEIYPHKPITLIHSRHNLMPAYHPSLSDLIKSRFAELGVNLITESRVVIPERGFPLTAQPTDVHLQDGRTLTADFVITATGQTPNNQWLRSSLGNDVINKKNGFVKVKPTMQIDGGPWENLFAVGDINDCGAHKAAKPGMVQAGVAARNITALIRGEEAEEQLEVAPAGIHLTLGLTKNVIFRNPDTAKGVTEPYINLKDEEDMNIEEVWGRRGPKVTSQRDYHL